MHVKPLKTSGATCKILLSRCVTIIYWKFQVIQIKITIRQAVIRKLSLTSKIKYNSSQNSMGTQKFCRFCGGTRGNCGNIWLSTLMSGAEHKGNLCHLWVQRKTGDCHPIS